MLTVAFLHHSHAWMDTHKISMLLEHDVPVGRHLHIPSPNSKYHEVTCRQAQVTVLEMLTRHASFTLVEAHSYVKILDKYLMIQLIFLKAFNYNVSLECPSF